MKKLWPWLLIYIIVVIVFSFSFDWLSQGLFSSKVDDIYPKFELLKLFLQGSGGLAVLVGIFISIRTLQLGEKNNEQSTQTLKLNYESLEVERFKLAIENLANNASEIRIAGFYTLVGIAVRDLFQRDNVINILLCFIRNKTKNDYLQPDEIQILLNLIFFKNKGVFSDLKIDFEEVHFNKLILNDAPFKDVSFHGAILDHLYFERANLINSYFTKAVIKNVIFDHSNLSYAYMNSSEFTKDSFCYTDLSNARFNSSILNECNFSGAKGITKDTFKGTFLLNKCYGLEPELLKIIKEENIVLKIL